MINIARVLDIDFFIFHSTLGVVLFWETLPSLVRLQTNTSLFFFSYFPLTYVSCT